jgi:hypothetical protein
MTTTAWATFAIATPSESASFFNFWNNLQLLKLSGRFLFLFQPLVMAILQATVAIN